MTPPKPIEATLARKPGLMRAVRTGDPITRFSESLQPIAINLERRTDEELAREALGNSDAVLREHALYQLLHRAGAEGIDVAEEAVRHDTDTQLRVNVLWALEQIGNDRCRRIALDLTKDEDPRVQDWARVFSWETGWSPEDFRLARPARVLPNRTFDETLFLHIKCDLYVRLSEDNALWGHVLLSPQMLARVYGQALACPITETRERELVIAKTLKGLHADGSDHHESFLFRGFTERTNPLQGNFYFESNTPRPFYKSGKADDTSCGVVENLPIPFAREGQWFLNPNMPIKGKYAIEYVRGLFQGWAYVNLDRIMEAGRFPNIEDYLFAGNSVLSTLHHPEVGPLTNTFVAGSFKGKVLDWDGDGVVDLNYLPAYATAKGEIDSDMDGTPDAPGLSVCGQPFHS